jgi:outer membrane protein assembly factor BamB
LPIDLDGQTQVILPGSGFVGGYDPANGHELWRVMYGEGYSVVPRPVYSHGLLFISSGFDSPVVYAVKPTGAKGNATSTNVAWTQRKAAPCTPSMLVVGDELYYVSDGGIATCADAVTGKSYWTHRFEGGFSASPVLADGHIYFQNENGIGYVIKPGTTYSQVAENNINERTLASYAVADRALYIRSDKHLWRISK